MDPQLRPAAPGHAHDAAPHPDARRRNGRQGGPRHRLPAQRLRKARRRPRLQPVRHHRRSDELHLADHERDRLASHRRKADGHRADAALQVHPHHPRRAGPHQRSSALRAGRRPSTWGRSPRSCTASTSARSIYDIFETVSGQRFPPELHARRRAARSTSATTFIRKVRTFVKEFPKTHADMCRLLNRNRIFVDRTQGHRRAVEGDGDQPELHRPDRPGQRRGPRPAQGRAVPGVPRFRSSRSSAPRKAIATPATWSAWRR